MSSRDFSRVFEKPGKHGDVAADENRARPFFRGEEVCQDSRVRTAVPTLPVVYQRVLRPRTVSRRKEEAGGVDARLPSGRFILFVVVVGFRREFPAPYPRYYHSVLLTAKLG